MLYYWVYQMQYPAHKHHKQNSPCTRSNRLYFNGFTTWWFPEMGLPLNHPFIDEIFLYKPTSYWGSPISGTPYEYKKHPKWTHQPIKMDDLVGTPRYGNLHLSKGLPKSCTLMGFSLINKPFWGYLTWFSLVNQPFWGYLTWFSLINQPAIGDI